MNIFWIIVIVFFVTVLGLLTLINFIFIKRDKLFMKYLQVGDICRYIIDEYDYKICNVIEINDNIIKLESKTGEIYITNIENVTAP